MALCWSWEDKCGEAIFKQGKKEFSVNLYQGNAFLIFIYEYEEDGQKMYNLYNFFLSKQHMKNCLGMNKKEGFSKNIFNEGYDRLKLIRINKAKYSYTKELTQALIQAFDEIMIELYNEE